MRLLASLTKEPRFYKLSKEVRDFDCYKRAVNQFVSQFGMSDYALKYYHVFVNMCNEDSHAF